jgi:Major intrinsic protein
MVLTAGLVSVILGTASGAQQLGPIAALGVGFYFALAGLWAAPVSGASMKSGPARSGQPLSSVIGHHGGCTWQDRLLWVPSRLESPTCCVVRAVAHREPRQHRGRFVRSGVPTPLVLPIQHLRHRKIQAELTGRTVHAVLSADIASTGVGRPPDSLRFESRIPSNVTLPSSTRRARFGGREN